MDTLGSMGFQDEPIASGVRVIVSRRRRSGPLRERTDSSVVANRHLGRRGKLAPPASTSIVKSIDQRPVA
jgi:hypothetical protein